MRHQKVGAGLFGTGPALLHHLDALRRLGTVNVLAIAGSDEESTLHYAHVIGVARAYGYYERLIADPDVQVVHVTASAEKRVPAILAALAAGKHVVSEAPAGRDLAQCVALAEAAAKVDLACAVSSPLRCNPMIQRACSLISKGQLGSIFFVKGQAFSAPVIDGSLRDSQGAFPTSGLNFSLADFIMEWCDIAQYVSGSRIESVLADMTEVFPLTDQAECAQSPNDGGQIGTALFRFKNGIKGHLTFGQMEHGASDKCRIEINGLDASVIWDQRQQNDLWIGKSGETKALLVKDTSSSDESRMGTRLLSSFPTAWADSLRDYFIDVYRWIDLGGGSKTKPLTVSTSLDSVNLCKIISCIQKSHRLGGVWLDVDGDPKPKN